MKITYTSLSSFRSYRSATPDDLSRNFQYVATDAFLLLPAEFKAIIDSWTNNKGYPLLTIVRIYDQGIARLSQYRYMRNKIVDPENIMYYIPVNVASRNQPNFTETKADFWLGGVPQKDFLISQDFHDAGPDDWIIVNKQQAYYYRVNYDDRNWRLLANQLDSDEYGVIHIKNRAQLVDDSFTLAMSGHVDFEVAFKILRYLQSEKDYVPWQAAENGLWHLDPFMRQNTIYRRFISSLVGPRYQELGFDNRHGDDRKTELLRMMMSEWACKSFVESCLTESNDFLKRILRENKTTTRSMEDLAYCLGMQNADQEMVRQLKELTYGEENDARRHMFLNGLSCTGEENLLRHVIADVLGNEKLSIQDRRSFFNYVLQNNYAGYRMLLEMARNQQKAEKMKKLFHGRMVDYLMALAHWTVEEETKNIMIELSEKYLTKTHHKAEIQIVMKKNTDFMNQYAEKIQKVIQSLNP